MTKETQIENAVLEYFNAQGYFAFKNYDQAKIINGAYQKHPWAMRGIADICLFINGQVVYVEVKTATGKQSVFQKKFEFKCKMNNIQYHVIRSLSDAKALIIDMLEKSN